MGSGLEAGGGFPLSGLVGWPADQAAERPPPHDLLGSGPDHRYLIGLGHTSIRPVAALRGGLEPLGAHFYPACGSLWRPVGTDWMPL